MIKTVNDYLQNYFAVDETQVKKLLRTEEASNFLLIWSIFEAKCFDGFCGMEKIKNWEHGFADRSLETQFNNIIQRFHSRYQNDAKWKNLRHNKPAPDMDVIKKRSFDAITDLDKVRFGLFVLFRYRNNIFHGNKKIDSWLAFTSQISDCIEMMILIMKDQKITSEHND